MRCNAMQCPLSLWLRRYDPTIGSMHALFLAAGPDFVRGHRVEAFQNIHISTIIGRILDLELPPNNGSEKVAAMVLGSGA